MATTAGLLITDIEGSTRLLQQLGPSYGDVLARHNEKLRAVFTAHDGVEQGNEGDSFFVTFPGADQAVAAAIAFAANKAGVIKQGAVLPTEVNLEAGRTSKTVTVPVLHKKNATVTATLSSPVGASIADGNGVCKVKRR